MEELIGEILLSERIITEQQLREALDRQKMSGGRIGVNLVALGHISEEDLGRFLNKFPQLPKTIEDTGLDLSFVSDLIIKTLLFTGEFRLSDIADNVKLPLEIVNAAVESLRRDQFVEVKGASGYAKTTYNFNITGRGKNRAEELLEICRYIGPAPVPLDIYRKMVEAQTIKHIVVDKNSVAAAFSNLVVSDAFLSVLGPAISSGKAIFLYGPAGNGKTTIAETIGRVLPGRVYIPYSIIVRGQIISMFDPVNHLPVEDGMSGKTDRRWVAIKRPFIMTGGELTMRMLDLDFNPIAKFYEAPLQMKANNGLFVVDDFGRQQMPPHNLLNRWVVPLERRTDFMTLHTGMKFDVPFDELVIFSTNIQPQKLVDEAFLRRIRYKIRIDHPTEEHYNLIFRNVCEQNGVAYNQDIYDYLMNNYYKRLGVKLNACHPRDILDHIIDDAHYYHSKPDLTIEGIDRAWSNYFVDM